MPLHLARWLYSNEGIFTVGEEKAQSEAPGSVGWVGGGSTFEILENFKLRREAESILR